ncbi:MAG: hypothetical protein ACOYN8_04685 [Pseudanabaena sp.]|jgi:hypothetical protein
MPKFETYIAIVAITLVSCQQNPIPNPTSFPQMISAGEKASDYLRSQIKLPPDVMIVRESEKLQTANINDLCQTTAPTQTGFEITLIAEDIRYILQTNQDASKIEICRSEDAKPELTSRYNGAGYMLRYPAAWKVIDLGLEPSGASTVIFTPSSEVLKGEDNLDPAKLQQKLQQPLQQNLQQRQQAYAIVSRRPIDGRASNNSNSFNDGSETAKDLVTTPFDPKIKGAKSVSKKEFTQEFTKGLADANKPESSSINSLIWKVKVLTIETDKFIYTIHNYQPNLKNDSNIENPKIFEQFTNSFALVSN